MHQFGWLSERRRGCNFLNLLQKEGNTKKAETGGGLNHGENYLIFILEILAVSSPQRQRSRGQQVTTYKQHITKTIHDDAMIEEKALHDATSN